MVTLDLVLLILALICFIAAAFGLGFGRINLIGAGLALYILSLVL